ncbi:hypothetical protein Vafri_4579 [Volvox africanus]|uniref:Uncharacterized protein n=1 Tax=Volvox africanus TaxID=51714 RepID=A0A8J4EUB9_9CHLO|nr:hypothetical protein Vafri_4579 [Volvox africanus]
MHEVIQEAMDVIFSKSLVKRQENQDGSSRSGSGGGGGGSGNGSGSGGGGSGEVDGGGSGSGSGGSCEVDGPPLVIHVNEGEWRNTRVIHLKVPTGEVEEYVRLLRQVLKEHGASITNCHNDEEALVDVLRSEYTRLTSAYKAETFKSITSNFSLLPHAGQLLETRPELFFRVPDQLQPSGGANLRAVWYGCRKYPCLVATLPGKPINGLSTGEVRDCMAALWKSNLKEKLVRPTAADSKVKTGGLQWAIVPRFDA